MEFNIQTMLYKKENNSEYLRILGEYFCRNNKNKGKLIINNKKYYLKEFIEIKNMKEKIIKIKMLINKNLYDKSYMFNDCESLLELTINDNLEYIENYENFEAIDYLKKMNTILYLKNMEKYFTKIKKIMNQMNLIWIIFGWKIIIYFMKIILIVFQKLKEILKKMRKIHH